MRCLARLQLGHHRERDLRRREPRLSCRKLRLEMHPDPPPATQEAHLEEAGPRASFIEKAELQAEYSDLLTKLMRSGRDHLLVAKCSDAAPISIRAKVAYLQVLRRAADRLGVRPSGGVLLHYEVDPVG